MANIAIISKTPDSHLPEPFQLPFFSCKTVQLMLILSQSIITAVPEAVTISIPLSLPRTS